MVNMSHFAGIYNNCATISIKKDSHICKSILDWFGVKYLLSSAISKAVGKTESGEWGCNCTEFLLDEFFKGKEIKHLVEIGTYLGVTALVFSEYADKVTTLDIWPRTDPIALWDMFGCKIDYHVSNKQHEIDTFVSKLDFDFAYIDADHSFESVERDFGLVKKCGRVLFHDYYLEDFGVKRFVDGLPKAELTFFEPFVYWERK